MMVFFRLKRKYQIRGGKAMKQQINRAERRRMAREQYRQTKKIQKLIGKNNPHTFISCPDCGSKDVTQIKKDYFGCNKCHNAHHISEMSVEL